jgi:hypothetical protein
MLTSPAELSPLIVEFAPREWIKSRQIVNKKIALI